VVPDLVHTRLEESLDFIGSPTHVNIFVSYLDFRSKANELFIVEVMSNWDCLLILLRHRVGIRCFSTFAGMFLPCLQVLHSYVKPTVYILRGFLVFIPIILGEVEGVTARALLLRFEELPKAGLFLDEVSLPFHVLIIIRFVVCKELLYLFVPRALTSHG